MINKFIFLITLLLFIVYYPFCQINTYSKEMYLFSIKDKNFKNILSRMVHSVKKCNYYGQNICFIVRSSTSNDKPYLSIEAISNKNVFNSKEIDKIKGYCFVDSHIFYFFSFLNENIIEKSNIKSKFLFKETGFIAIEDYIISFYLYNYKGLTFIKTVNECL